MKILSIIALCLFSLCSLAKEPKPSKNYADSIFVSKSKKTMTLYAKKWKIKTYHISIGQNPIGHKQYEGDNRTPEGLYYINDKNPNSAYYKNLGISYPNQRDILNAKKRKQKPGGQIKIHGYADAKGSTKEKNIKYTYTWGCIGLTNQDMNEVYDCVKVGAKILIVR